MSKEGSSTKKSMVSLIDPRIKLVFAPLFSVSLFFVDNIFFLMLLTIAFVLLSIDEFGFKGTLKAFVPIVTIVFFLFLMSPLEKRDGTPILKIGDFTLLTEEALDKVSLIAFRFTLISLAFYIVIKSEKERELVRALRWFHIPYNACLCISLIFRFIPYVASLYEEIRMSLSMRLNEGKRGYKISPFLIALVINSIKMVSRFSSALEERGFGAKNRVERKMKVTTSFVVGLVFSITIPALIVIFM